jgi:hypothetical protein
MVNPSKHAINSPYSQKTQWGSVMQQMVNAVRNTLHVNCETMIIALCVLSAGISVNTYQSYKPLIVKLMLSPHLFCSLAKHISNKS